MSLEQQHKYFLRLHRDGSISSPAHKTLYINQNTWVRFIVPTKSSSITPKILFRKSNPVKGVKKLPQYIQYELKGQPIEPVQYPLTLNTELFMNTFDLFDMQLDLQGDWFSELFFDENQLSGSVFFRLLWVTNNQDQIQIELSGAPNYLILQPKQNLREMTIQTLLPYCLGDFPKWEEQIRSQVELGYKAFHLPPIQKLGESGSLYSISDQLTLNPDLLRGVTLEHFKEFFLKFEGIKFFLDILPNHTAFDSEWLNEPEHSKSVYTEITAPHLSVAIELDKAIAQFSNELGNKKTTYPKGNIIENEQDLDKIMEILTHQFVLPLKLHEYFQMNPQVVLQEIQKRIGSPISETEVEDEDENIFIKNPRDLLPGLLRNNIINKGVKRFGVALDYDVITRYLLEHDNYKMVSQEFILKNLNEINKDCRLEADRYIGEALGNTRGQIKWQKIEQRQFQIYANAKGDSLVPRYFTPLKNGTFAANNGWIADYDALKNFAENQDHHYFRRSIIIWGDLIKLRYGNSKRDSPALWKRMKKYVQTFCKIFQGIRIDNAHSTPLNVGEYLMRKARQSNNQILIFAELFAGSPEKDSIFTKRLGFNALVRETNRCHTGSDIHGTLHYYSGDGDQAIGTLPPLVEHFSSLNEPYYQLQPQVPLALVYEQSHDNETLIQSHSFKHQLPIASLISFANCMKGTIRGYDQYQPTRLSVVDERRLYLLPEKKQIIKEEETVVNVQFRFDTLSDAHVVEVRGSWDDWQASHCLTKVQNFDPKINTFISSKPLIANKEYEFKYIVNGEWQNPKDKFCNANGNHVIQLKKQTKKIYFTMENIREILTNLSYDLQQNFPYIHVDSHYNSLITIARGSRNRTQIKLVIAQPVLKAHYNYPVVELPGELENVDFIWVNDDEITHRNDPKVLLPSVTKIHQTNDIHEFADIYYNYETRCHVLKFNYMPQSFVAVISCRVEDNYQKNLVKLEEELQNLTSDQIQRFVFSEIQTTDLNFLLFSSEQEENDRNQQGLFFVPNFRQLVYAGFAGPLSAIRDAQKNNNIGHPLFDNLRKQNWLLDYLFNRMTKNHEVTFKPVIELSKTITELLKNIPRYQIPHYFSRFVEGMVYQAKKRAIQKSAPYIKNSMFFRELSLASYQFIAPIATFDKHKQVLCAGLPHFTTGWARAWGRDTFISFKGIYLLNGLYREAKETIFQFASCLRHGLIPNLLDSGRQPRYNCRDACWWYIKAVKDYMEYTGDQNILKETVEMKFLDDDMEKHVQKKAQNLAYVMTIEDTIQKIFQCHAVGVVFREWKAGNEIDGNMESEGFNIELTLDLQTGFIVGGNWRNQLTWMDKMGSSSKAGNKGFPATSRDGAPIELTALLKLALEFVINCKQYKYDGVKLKNGQNLHFKQWAELIQQNFEKNYWVPKNKDQYIEYNISEKNVRQTEIYKDLTKSSKIRNEYQLRCNACIAIALSPELFSKDKCKLHLQKTEEALIEQNSLGLKTLDKIHSEYLHYYDNSDDSNQFSIAHGFSYHNGPEWVWVYGYYLKALISVYGKSELTQNKFYSQLLNHKRFIHENEWFSLPEMTNGNGEHNHFSCRAQAWSIACILEAIDDFQKIQ